MKKWNFMLLMIGVALTVQVQGQTMGNQTLAQLDESPAGAKIIQYVAAVNEGKPISQGWIKEMFAPKLIESVGVEKLQEMIAETQEMEGALHLYSARRKSLNEYKLLLNGVKSGEWLEMVFFFEKEEPYRVLGITLDSTDAEPASDKPIFPKS